MVAPLDFSGIRLDIRREGGRVLVFDVVRKKWVVLTPEENVRQLLLHYLIDVLHYPAAMMAVEKGIAVGRMQKRFDLVVYNRAHEPWLLAECKAPDVPVTEKTLHQLLAYQRTVQCQFWLLTNGPVTFCADARDPAQIAWMELLPSYNL